MTDGSATYSSYVEGVFWFVTGISGVIFIGIVVAMVYFIIRYSRKRNPYPTNIEGNVKLEILWTVIPLILVLGMFWYGWIGYKELLDVPKDAIPLKVTGQMWQWTFEYPNGVQTDTMRVPVHTPVKLEITAIDVNHSFFVPAFRTKRDAIPGKLNTMWFNATGQGAFDVACAEYCGLKHSQMYTKIIVQDSLSFETWYRAISEEQSKPYESLLTPPSPTAEAEQDDSL
jgi:cytochrome c oxidase subunit 2